MSSKPPAPLSFDQDTQTDLSSADVFVYVCTRVCVCGGGIFKERITAIHTGRPRREAHFEGGSSHKAPPLRRAD